MTTKTVLLITLLTILLVSFTPLFYNGWEVKAISKPVKTGQFTWEIKVMLCTFRANNGMEEYVCKTIFLPCKYKLAALGGYLTCPPFVVPRAEK